jgi:hypothetical protein
MYIRSAHVRPCEKQLYCFDGIQWLSVDIPFTLDYYTHAALFERLFKFNYGRVTMVEKTLLLIITFIFLVTCWWWSNRQEATENFYEEQLRERDAVVAQLCTVALPQVQGKSPEQVQELFQGLYPQHDVHHDNGVIFSGELGVRFSEKAIATGFFLPWDDIEKAPSQ